MLKISLELFWYCSENVLLGIIHDFVWKFDSGKIPEIVWKSLAWIHS